MCSAFLFYSFLQITWSALQHPSDLGERGGSHVTPLGLWKGLILKSHLHIKGQVTVDACSVPCLRSTVHISSVTIVKYTSLCIALISHPLKLETVGRFNIDIKEVANASYLTTCNVLAGSFLHA